MSEQLHVVPYVEIAGVPFGSREEAVVAVHGEPRRRQVDTEGRMELNYDAMTVRLHPNDGRVIEATVDADSILISGCSLPDAPRPELAFVELGCAIAKRDPDSFFVHGFFVSPRFGITFDPHCASWITAFARSQLSSLQALRDSAPGC